ncbi:hypothetical protein LDENG_00220130 [Lucifuga dentata]|nr:hypothetical protein LDENG_00220130 [Lucifuga dentata]
MKRMPRLKADLLLCSFLHRLTELRFKRKSSADEEPPSCCAVCLDSLKDLVSTSCGHRFCRDCISSYWQQSAASGGSSCPQCGQRSKSRAGPQSPRNPQTPQTDISLQEYKLSLKRRCEAGMEGTCETGSGTSFTRICITEGQKGGHEVQLDKVSKMESLHNAPIKCQDIFKLLPGQHTRIRVVLTNGVAGVGKTFIVQKFSLDWAEGLQNQDVGLLVLVSFRQLNLIQDQQISLVMLLHVFHPTLQTLTAETLAVCKVLFIFDGLDESRLSLDFQDKKILSDVTQKSSVGKLLTNLITGNLLPSALVWITHDLQRPIRSLLSVLTG